MNQFASPFRIYEIQWIIYLDILLWAGCFVAGLMRQTFLDRNPQQRKKVDALSSWRSKVTSYARQLNDDQRTFEKLVVDKDDLDTVAADCPDPTSLVTDLRGQARALNDLIDSYERIAESKMEYLRIPDRHHTLTVPMLPGESEKLEESRK